MKTYQEYKYTQIKVVCSISLLFSLYMSLFSCTPSLKKSYESLNKYDYFQAKKNFEHSLKKDKKSCGAHYGLAMIYFGSDNPFQNPDTAYYHVLKALEYYPMLSGKNKSYLKEHQGIDSLKIDSLKQAIDSYFFTFAREVDQVKSYQNFIDLHPTAKELNQAIKRRDELAYDAVYKKGTSAAMENFMQTYPQNHLMDEAISRYERLIYEENTDIRNINSYVEFVKKFKGNPHVGEAEDKVYELFFSSYDIQEYESFIKKYPTNRNVENAWRNLLDLFLTDYSAEQIAKFSNLYPNYPFQEELRESYQLANTLLFPFIKNGKWGFKDKSNQIWVQPVYEWVEKFHSGIAQVGYRGKHNFIDKKGTLINQKGFDDAFPFSEEVAVVEIEEKMGAINRVGHLVIPAIYDDLISEKEGVLLAEKDDSYFYIKADGTLTMDMKFEDAKSFDQGRAHVFTDNGQGIIDHRGNWLIPDRFEQILPFQQNYYRLENDEGYWGVISISGDTLIPFDYDYIGELSENRAVAFEEDFYGYIDSTGMWVIKPDFETALLSRELLNFKSGHALFEAKNKIGLIDINGKKKIPAIFKSIGNYGELIPILKENFWGYCDTNTRLKIPYQYDWAGNFQDTLALVRMNGMMGVINTEGIFIVSPIYENIVNLDGYYWMVNKEGGGVYSKNGEALFEEKFVNFEHFADNWYKFQRPDDTFSYYNVKEQIFLSGHE